MANGFPKLLVSITLVQIFIDKIVNKREVPVACLSVCSVYFSVILTFSFMFLVGITCIEGFEDVYNAVDTALECGYRSFDCSPEGTCEQNLGQALEELLPKYNLTRNDILLASKLLPKDYGSENVSEAFGRSCDNLKTDYLDLFLMSWPGGKNLKFEDENNRVLREATWKELVKLNAQGVVRNLGVCHFLPKHLANIQECSGKIPCLNQVEFHPKCPQVDVMHYCKENNIIVQACSFKETYHPLILNDKVVQEVASNVRKTSTQVLLKWTINKGVAVTPQSTSPKKIRQNFNLFDFVLEKPDMNLIDTITTREKYLRNPICIV